MITLFVRILFLVHLQVCFVNITFLNCYLLVNAWYIMGIDEACFRHVLVAA